MKCFITIFFLCGKIEPKLRNFAYLEDKHSLYFSYNFYMFDEVFFFFYLELIVLRASESIQAASICMSCDLQ